MTGEKNNSSKKLVRWLSLAAAVVVLAAMAVIWRWDNRSLVGPRLGADLPPVITFTWTPLGPLDLKDFHGRLTLHDDHALDFTTYRFRFVELDKALDLPVDGLVGKDYESDVYLALLADDPRLADLDHLTIEISVADDRGQKTVVEHAIRLKPRPTSLQLKAE